MSKMRPVSARILVHSEGLGTPTPAMVRKRAEEIALINGRTEFTEADWRQAKIEMHGCHGPDGELSDEMAMAAMSSERDMLAADVGHQTERMALDDERNLVEELWVEGMEEAEHERMLAARKELHELDEEEAE
jgi:hypothetical protein